MNKLPNCIKKIISSLETTPNISNELLKKIIKNANVSEQELLKYNTFEHPETESYGRSFMYQGKHFLIYVMSWVQGDFTAIHSHGHSDWGAVYFLGDADHRTYTANKNNVQLLSKEAIKKGTVSPVCGDFVHAMGNLSSHPFVTLHIYGSNTFEGTVTEDSTIYEISEKKIYTSKGPAFLNMDNKLYKTQRTGLITNRETEQDYKTITQLFLQRQSS